ncbi:MAG: APC family permease [Gemmatimonadales bacterium]
MLRRAIQLRHATALVAGIMIGASIFVQPSEVARLPSVAGVLMVWLAAGVLTLLGALVIADLARLMPESGGVYVYLARAFGPAIGFTWGWAMFWTMHTGIVAAIAIIFARYAAFVVPAGATGQKAIAIGAVVLLSAINYVGVGAGSRLQTAFTAAKLLAIAAIVAAGLVFGGRVPEHFQGPASPPPVSIGIVITALAAGLFAFGGWHMVSYSAGETVDPERTIPRALLLGTLIVTAAYLAMNAIYLYVLPLDRVASSSYIAADFAAALFGRGAGAAMAAVVMFSSAGALAGVILTGPRVYHAMAQDRLAPRWIAAVHPRFQTPHRAVVLQALWAAVLILTGTFRALFTRVVYTEWIFFGCLAVGLMLLLRRIAVLPAIFAIAAFTVVIEQVAANPRDALFGLGFVLTGLPVYYVISRRTSSSE